MTHSNEQLIYLINKGTLTPEMAGILKSAEQNAFIRGYPAEVASVTFTPPRQMPEEWTPQDQALVGRADT